MSVRDNRKQAKRTLRRNRHLERATKKAQRERANAAAYLQAMGVREALVYLDLLVDFVLAIDELEERAA